MPINPSHSFQESPEKWLVDHCSRLSREGGLCTEERILAFVRRLLKQKIAQPVLDLGKFPIELQTEKIKVMCDHLKELGCQQD